MKRKYGDLIQQLEDQQLYSAGTITRFAQTIGYCTTHTELLRIRIVLNYCAQKHLPRLGDGWLRPPGQGPIMGWFGWRWKQARSDGEAS